MRWHILKTLIKKEALRFRCNRGLLVIVGAVLALAALISMSARLGQLPGQRVRKLTTCLLLYDGGNPAALAWVDSLKGPAPPDYLPPLSEVNILAGEQRQWQRGNRYELPDDWLGVELVAPTESESGPHRVRYWFNREAVAEVVPYRLWLTQATHRHLGHLNFVEERDRTTRATIREMEPEDRVPLIVTALVIFSFYLLSFNIYITTTGEEREKKALLALMLTPATPAEVIGAKVVFYAILSLVCSALVVLLFKPSLLAQPLLWSTIVVGSVTYVAIGTVVLCIVRRQTTISTISMMYLIFTAIIMFLSVFLLPFYGLRLLLVENYLYRQLQEIIAERPNLLARIDQPIMLAIMLAWLLVALRLFRSRGLSMARVNR
ncbi:MAG TPA: ABC transporter permease [Gemmatales bacterium]|nr:ABC transporter permease [Gemmatales bacterium]HMP60480.1 ABC transporter permease [Gemmatales bacterium]